MNRGGPLAKYLALLGGITVAMSASNTASAQPPCPLVHRFLKTNQL
jgi:hypothetical protein